MMNELIDLLEANEQKLILAVQAPTVVLNDDNNVTKIGYDQDVYVKSTINT
jgi:hypothetical protein